MITIKNVTKKFIKTNKKKERHEFTAVNNLSFDVLEGEILGIPIFDTCNKKSHTRSHKS